MGIPHLLDWFLNWSVISGILDVVLVYFLIYRTLLMVRGTRAEPMLLGLAIIVLVYVVSRELNLSTLNWILGNFLGSVILVIVVLFQDDLRRALTKVGLFPGFNTGAPEALELSIKEIAKAAGELASRRIGGLIVIRRDVGLEEYTENAVKIDAEATHQLLTSIFLPASPLHDGAVVIEGRKILVAGAVLPLTFNPSVSNSYGTRHRAAIGLSERTDALVVVISEETGGITLVREGKAVRDLDERSLYNALHRLTVFKQQRQRRGTMRILRRGKGDFAVSPPREVNDSTDEGSN
jgi:diadenylate cyclase